MLTIAPPNQSQHVSLAHFHQAYISNFRSTGRAPGHSSIGICDCSDFLYCCYGVNCNSCLCLFERGFGQILVGVALRHSSIQVQWCENGEFEKSLFLLRQTLVAEGCFVFLSFSRHPIMMSGVLVAAASYFHWPAYSDGPSPNPRAAESQPSALPLTYSSKSQL